MEVLNIMVDFCVKCIAISKSDLFYFFAVLCVTVDYNV